MWNSIYKIQLIIWTIFNNIKYNLTTQIQHAWVHWIMSTGNIPIHLQQNTPFNYSKGEPRCWYVVQFIFSRHSSAPCIHSCMQCTSEQTHRPISQGNRQSGTNKRTRKSCNVQASASSIYLVYMVRPHLGTTYTKIS